MRFNSTLVITLLVPILSLLASFRAAPSGLRSRDNRLFDVGILLPTGLQEVQPGSILNLQISYVAQNDFNTPHPPPWTVKFGFIDLSFGKNYFIQDRDIRPTFLSGFDVIIPGDIAPGVKGQIYCNYRHSCSAHASAYTI
ncbi:hypothetical protein BC826DRAFT_967702 [Russula brevipes]|nr:hypothetical protein BC826DRAFT_967702 [Russula brevipes]